jgi:hypothetical protein
VILVQIYNRPIGAGFQAVKAEFVVAYVLDSLGMPSLTNGAISIPKSCPS